MKEDKKDMTKDESAKAEVEEKAGLKSSQKELMAEKAQLAAEKAELVADLQRTRADFENYRKQVEMQRSAAVKLGQLATVRRVLPLLDDIDRAIQAYAELKPLEKSLEKVLSELTLAKIPAEPGTEFNPDLHEAVMAEGEGANETVSEVLRPGYYYEGEVLRPTMVKVYKKD